MKTVIHPIPISASNRRCLNGRVLARTTLTSSPSTERIRAGSSKMTDIFYVLQGELAFDLEGEWRVLGPGSFVLVPPGVVHTFANRGSVPARVLNIHHPA